MHHKPLAPFVLALALLVLASRPLLAGSRDDVLAGMFHCASIGDTRMWLDCFYGAAQPVRAELGLPPAPPDQVRLSQSPPAGAVAAADLTSRYQATADALQCNSMTDDRGWLNCYYGAAQSVRTRLGLVPLPAARAIPGSMPPPNHLMAASAGGSGLALGWQQMTSYSFNRTGTFTVALANGQRWRQLSGDTTIAHWTKPVTAYWVHISRGALNSLNLTVKGEAAVYKVEKVE